MKLTGDSRRDFEKNAAENIQLRNRLLSCREQIHDLMSSLGALRKAKESQQSMRTVVFMLNIS